MTHKERANQLLHQQYHCSQALFGAFAKDLGMDLKTAFCISTCFSGGMRQGSTCGCITASLLVLGMVFGFYDPQNKEQEICGNQKTEEFMQRFTERMKGMVDCRDILGKDISNPNEMAQIHEEGLILQKCPQVIYCSIEILEEMLADYLKNNGETARNPDEIPENEMHRVLKGIQRRRLFQKNVSRLLSTSAKNIAFIQFDICKFKIVNDLYGEKFGDEVLAFVSRQLEEFCGEQQFFINLRSDVFMIVTEYAHERDLSAWIRQFDSKTRIFKSVKLQMSYGVYIIEDKTMELRLMEDRAAMARMAAKNNLLSNIVFYQKEFKEVLYNRKFIEENMQSAIAEKQFCMYLQPKYSIVKNEIIGAEALVRWNHPLRGIIYPGQFIPVIEENGFIKKLDYYIWEEACRFIKRCEAAGIYTCPISVNVSRIHLRDSECLGILSDMLKDYSVPKQLLELEITETTNDQQFSLKALQLKEEGFTLLMDNFGSGYSSLNILLETPFDMIKLDRKFMGSVMLFNKGQLILEQIISMAAKLQLEVLAEGVETREQMELLRNIGCDQVQGYYYAKPMPSEELFELLVEQSR